jgi:hypothetical protein
MRQQNTSIFAQLGKREMLSLFALGAIFAILSIGNILTRAPWCDEAYFGEPAYRLSTVGQMSTLVVPPSPIDDPKTVGTDRYTFYAMPLHLVMQAGLYKIAGFGITQQRLISFVWALVALVSWWVILAALGADAYFRTGALALTTLDYTFVRASSDGRMDMMSAALGTLGLAVFLCLQSRWYSRAILLASLCAAASAFTHPVGGLISTAALGIAILWFSHGRFRLWHVGLAAVPYLFLLAGWGVYISRAPDIFRGQFSSISSGRLSAWKQPLTAIYREVTERWAGAFGFTASGFKRLKAVALLLDCAGLIWSLLRLPRTRHNKLALLPLIALSSIAILCFAESTKSAAYLVHIVPLLTVLTAWLLDTYRKSWGLAVLAAALLVQLAGSAYQISRFEYSRVYAPAVAFLKNHGGDVTGVASLGYGLGFGHELTDDRRLGFYTGRTTRYIVVDSTYQDSYNHYPAEFPAFDRYVHAQLAQRNLVFANPLFRIYEK